MVDVPRLQMWTVRYELADGVRDFQTAFWVFVTGVYALLVWELPEAVLTPVVALARDEGGLFALLIAMVFGLGVPVIISELGLRLVNDHVRRRWLWRETGFIEPQRWIVPRSVLVTAFGVAMITFVAGIFLANAIGDGWFVIKSLWIGIALQFATLYFLMGRRLEIARYRWVALGCVLSPILLVPLPMSAGVFCMVLSILIALVLVASGVAGIVAIAQQQSELERSREDDAA